MPFPTLSGTELKNLDNKNLLQVFVSDLWWCMATSRRKISIVELPGDEKSSRRFLNNTQLYELIIYTTKNCDGY